MSVTVTPLVTDNLGGATMVVATVAFDDSYPTGGEAIVPAALGLDTVQALIPASAGGYVFEYDYANNKLLAYMGNNDGAADGPLVEVADTTDLSAVTSRLVAFGR